MGDMTAQMDQMNFNALLVNVTFKSDFFMKKVFLYNQERLSKEKKRHAFLHTAKLAIILDYKGPWMLCLALQPGQNLGLNLAEKWF